MTAAVIGGALKGFRADGDVTDTDIFVWSGVKKLDVRGIVERSAVLAGTSLGPDRRFGIADDDFQGQPVDARGRAKPVGLDNISIRGVSASGHSAIDTLFAVGVDPVNDVLGDGDDGFSAGGLIKKVKLVGDVFGFATDRFLDDVQVTRFGFAADSLYGNWSIAGQKAKDGMELATTPVFVGDAAPRDGA